MTTYTYPTSSSDSYSTVSGPLKATDANLYIAGSPAMSDADVRTWLPFVVNIPQGKTIATATLRVTAADTDGVVFLVVMYCNAVDNAVAPTNTADLFSKTATTSVGYNLAAYTVGVEYSYDVTVPVQAILNRAGWVSGNTLAIIIEDSGAVANQRRSIASYESGAGYAMLDILVNYVPKGSGLI